MPDTVGGLIIFAVFLIPGFISTAERARRVPTRQVSALYETVNLVTVSIFTNLAALALLGVLRIWHSDRMPNPDSLVNSFSVYSANRLEWILAWGVVLLAISCIAAWGVAHTRFNFGPFTPAIIQTSAWYHVFEDEPDNVPEGKTARPFVRCELEDGVYVSGDLAWYSTEVEETADRDLVLADPTMIGGEYEFSESPSRLIVSSRRIKRLYVDWYFGDPNAARPGEEDQGRERGDGVGGNRDEAGKDAPTFADINLDLKKPGSPNWTLIWVLAAVVFGALAVGMWLAGAFDEPSDQAAATRFEASLTLVGVLVVEVAAIGGLALKHEAGVRTYTLGLAEEYRLRVEATRTHDRAEKEGERLRLDRVLGAVALMGTDSGSAAAPSQLAGAIQALIRLGEPDIAFGSLSRAWATKELDPASCVNLVSELIELGDESTAEAAAALLKLNASTLGDAPFPSPFNGDWPDDDAEVPTQVKIEILAAITELLEHVSEQPYANDRADLEFRPWLLACICESARQKEPENSEPSQFATALLHAFLPVVRARTFRFEGQVYAFDNKFTSDLAKATAALDPGGFWRDPLKKIGEWAKKQGPLL